MKYILISVITLFLSLNISAKNVEDATEVFHSRLSERSPGVYTDTTISLLEVVPAEIEQIAAHSFVGLVNFAISLDLFEKGFGYVLNENFYEVTKSNGEVVAYNFSISIMKDGAISSIGMYELHRRVDGVFYLSREPAWY